MRDLNDAALALLRAIADAESLVGPSDQAFNYFFTLDGADVTHDALGKVADTDPTSFDRLVRASAIHTLTRRPDFARFYLTDAGRDLVRRPSADTSAGVDEPVPPGETPTPRLRIGFTLLFVLSAILIFAWDPKGRGTDLARFIDGGAFGLSVALLAAAAFLFARSETGVAMAAVGVAAALIARARRSIGKVPGSASRRAALYDPRSS